MRLDFKIEIAEIEIPRFSVEAQEGIGKLFTLATLVFNVLDSKEQVQVVFHGLNSEDPERKIAAFQEIMNSAASTRSLRFETGEAGRVRSSSSYFQWLTIHGS